MEKAEQPILEYTGKMGGLMAEFKFRQKVLEEAQDDKTREKAQLRLNDIVSQINRSI